MTSGPQETRPSTASERQRLVSEYEATLKATAAQQRTEADSLVRRQRQRRPVLLGSALVVTVLLWLFPPAWFRPAPPPGPSPAQRAAGDRFAIFLQVQQIEQYRTASGRLPATLAEAGEPLPGVVYTRLEGSGYTLVSERDPTIAYRAGEDLAAFLGNSVAELGGVHAAN